MGDVSTRTRVIRYGAPIALVIVGILFAAVQTSRLGNDVQTLTTAGGLIWLIAVIGRDMGMGISSGQRRRIPVVPPPPGGEDAPGADGAGDQPPVSPS